MGFETDLFVTSTLLDDNYLCSICHGVQDKPTTACRNGHTFCEKCLTTWLEKSNKCPDCRSTVMCSSPSGNRVLCRPLHNLILSLMVTCPEPTTTNSATTAASDEATPPMEANTNNNNNKANAQVSAAAGDETNNNDTNGRQVIFITGATGGSGDSSSSSSRCGWEGSLLEYLEKHKPHECQYAVVECPRRGCSCRVRQCQLEYHKRHDCVQRRVTCDLCLAPNIKHVNLITHKTNKCPEANVVCIDCGRTMKRKELGVVRKVVTTTTISSTNEGGAYDDRCDYAYTKHLKVCPKLKVECEFAHVGCNCMIPREDVDDHHATYARHHAKLVANALYRLEMDKRWLPEQAVTWEISKSVIEDAINDEDMDYLDVVAESEHFPVGTFMAFFQLAVYRGLVRVYIRLENSMFPLIVDRIDIRDKDGTLVLSMMEAQEMDSSVHGILRVRDHEDDGNHDDEDDGSSLDNNWRSATLVDLLDRTALLDGNSSSDGEQYLSLYARFRIAQSSDPHKCRVACIEEDI